MPLKQIRRRKADVEAQKAAVAQAELNLHYTKIISPIDGLAGAAIANHRRPYHGILHHVDHCVDNRSHQVLHLPE